MPEQSVCHANALGRRSFLAFGGETALLALLAIVTAPVSVKAVQIAPEDPRLKAERVNRPELCRRVAVLQRAPGSPERSSGERAGHA